MRFGKSGLVLLLVISVVVTPFAAEAQQAGRVYRIGYMSVVSRQSAEPLMVIFLRALRDLGWIEGRNLLVEWRWADGKVERLSGFATELAKLNVDLIVAPQSDSALAAKRVTHTIPIVHVVAGDPIADGLVTSLARPGGNVTGLTVTPSPQIAGKRLELLKEATGASRIAVLWNPARRYPYIELAQREVNASAQVLGIKLRVVEARGPDQIRSCVRGDGTRPDRGALDTRRFDVLAKPPRSRKD